MARAESSLVVNCPMDKVFALLADISRGTEWQSALLEVQLTSNGPMGIGTTIREVRRLLGRNLETAFTVTEYEPDNRLRFKSTSGPIQMQAYFSLDATSEGTKVDMTVEAELTGVFKMTEPMVVFSAKRQMDSDLAKLKEILEGDN